MNAPPPGYSAIEFIQAGTTTDEDGQPDRRHRHVLARWFAQDLCVGCGLCQSRCFAVNVKDKKVLKSSAIVMIEAGAGRDERLSLVEWRKRAILQQDRRDLALANPTGASPSP